MALHLQLDVLGGIAGDMFIAALLDARPDLVDGMCAAVRDAGLPRSARLELVPCRDGVLAGSRLLVEPPADDDRHHHTAHRDIVAQLRASALEPAVRDRALRVFALLAAAEASVHGIEVDDVEFHEVGAWDSIADIVGAAWLLEKLAVTSWSHGPLPVGSGRVRTAHGPLPVPAPATARLLQGFTIVDDGIPGERITPTGAAILRHLRHELGEPRLHEARVLLGTGCGFGTRTLPGISNVLRVLLCAQASVGALDERIGLLEFEIDDQTPEDLAAGLDVLRAHPAVLDALQAPALGKKGRMVTQVRLLCRPEALDDVATQCFVETTTLGVRKSTVTRVTLPRELQPVEVGDRSVRVKVARRPDGRVTRKADSDDVAGPGGHSAREARRQAAEQETGDIHLFPHGNR